MSSDFRSKLKNVVISGREVLPIVEGGKGVSVTNGYTAGAFAAAGAVGTFSGVNADTFDKDGKAIPYVYKATTRKDRHEELIAQSSSGGITQGTTTITSATAAFTSAIVGNFIYLTGGTGSIAAQWREVTVFTNATTVTIDAAIAASTGMTMNIGGALSSPGQAAASVVAGNTIYIKNGTYTLSTSTSNVSGGVLNIALASIWEGYGTTRGDLISPFTFIAGAVTNVTIWALSSTNSSLRNAILDGNSGSGNRGCSISGIGYLLTLKNCPNRGASTGSGTLIRCLVTNCGTFGLVASIIIRCEAYANTGPGIANAGNTNDSITDCLSYGNTGGTTDGFQLFTSCMVTNCVAYGNGRDGFRMTASQSQPMLNCIAEGNTGFGFSGGGSVRANSFLLNCVGYNNTGGNVDTTNLTGLNIGFVTLTGSPFTNAAGNDFSLNNTGGAGASCRAGGYPGTFPRGISTGYLDIGAVQHADPPVVVSPVGGRAF